MARAVFFECRYVEMASSMSFAVVVEIVEDVLHRPFTGSVI
jgi:hypothetical protein